MALRTTGMEFATEMVVKATLLKMTIAEVPPHCSGWTQSSTPLTDVARWLAHSALLPALQSTLVVPLSWSLVDAHWCRCRIMVAACTAHGKRSYV